MCATRMIRQRVAREDRSAGFQFTFSLLINNSVSIGWEAPRPPGQKKKAQYQKSTSDRKHAYLRRDKAAKRWLCIVPDFVRRVAS